MNPLYAALPTTVFTMMSALAREHGAINLGQGFPDTPGPRAIRKKAADEVLDGYNQYPPMPGLPELRQAIARHYSAFQGLDLDWQGEVTVTSGATEALACAFLALLSPGEEAVVFEPAYDAYAPMIRRAGATPRFVRLEPPCWRIERERLEAAIGPATRVIVLNTPGNPSGAMASAEALALIGEICERHDLALVCDEVWEQVALGGAPHLSPLALPALRQRCVKIGSAGKLFALTGWKVGWMCAAPPLTEVLAKAHQFLTFATPPSLQAAVAFGLGASDDWFATMPAALAASRDRLAAALAAEGFVTLPTAGAYFLNVDLAASGVALDDVAFCRLAVERAGVAAIPLSAFYESDAERRLIRLCFAKADATLDEAARRLGRARRLQPAASRDAPRRGQR